MLFNQVKKEHILQGINDFEEKGFPDGFGPSSTYDVICEGKSYPPKAIMAYANYYAEGRTIERYFKGGIGTDCFNAFERNGFNVVKKEKPAMNEELHKLKQEFLDYWSLEKLQNMTLEEYTDTKRENSFCYWLEHLTRGLGSIRGGSSYKFGIYEMRSSSETKPAHNRTNNGVYAWHTKYGATQDEAFQNIKNIIIQIASLSQSNKLETLDDIDLGDAYKWKIAFLYGNFNIINIFNRDSLTRIVLGLELDLIESPTISQLNQQILGQKPENEEFFTFSHRVWNAFGLEKDKVKEFEKWLKKQEDTTSGKISSYLRALNILTDHFKIRIYDEQEIQVLEDLYEDLILHQRNSPGKYYYSKAKSYGEGGFYSAAIKLFIQFLNHNTSVNKNINQVSNIETMAIQSSTNQILYGPPGTGKTYYLKDQLFDKYTSRETFISKDQYFESIVSECSWWQVIAIALMDLGSSKVSDIYAHEWVHMKERLSKTKTVRPTIWGQLQSHTVEECGNVNVSNRQQPLIFNKTKDSYWEILEEQVKELVPELYRLKDSIENYSPDPDKIVKYYDFVTFHQSFAYEDFIEGIKPILPETEADETKDLGYTIEDGVFKSLCSKANNDPDNRYAIFIDEINRGNVSAIFGELITLIEIDKRKGAKNALSIRLPYSKQDFSVPSNLDIYGTMNTADRSVEALDTALRRRFSFKEMMPDYAVLKDQFVNEISLSQVLKTINQRIEILVDRDHTIGHSYFIDIKNPKELANAFNDKIIPLLQEYFYGDYGKIGLVLGEGFVDKTETKDIAFAIFKYEDSEDFKTPKYNLIKANESNIIASLKILLSQVEEPFVI